ncbi:L,D-peptidoglycan transpeptidase YkuD, ErfK/YbiS/YcfS/YnhG family [Paenibacillus sp. 1_12]|uniref:L,D-transpeptidase family protein n=1 Tax=Paenibacillus sp. 1_12 TaxID=1566278 RepID=UPI0008E5A992|nr:L,D-transpeptidase family protein [Paenibacillus sp. 1_12]SFM07464.1 L,D-peptidoglycan transpeptidase YkuD, ErfK/YbiS/YcfS/YnhG family [Paenibacillus sp. 1_12]
MVHILNQRMLDSVSDSEQIIVVEIADNSLFHATVKLFEKTDQKWAQTIDTIPAVIGKNGLTDDKSEGDGKSPRGLYELGESFGSRSVSNGFSIPYHQVTLHDYWIDDPYSDEYNQWIYYEGIPSSKWNSFETLVHPLYTYAIIIKYNMEPVIKGKGSAIFIHEWESESSPTLGCIAMSYDHLVLLMNSIQPQKNPKIRIG